MGNFTTAIESWNPSISMGWDGIGESYFFTFSFTLQPLPLRGREAVGRWVGKAGGKGGAMHVTRGVSNLEDFKVKKMPFWEEWPGFSSDFLQFVNRCHKHYIL